jgi:phosphatidylglycerophosphate synthase
MIQKDNPTLQKLRLIIAKPFLRIHPNVLTMIGVCFDPLFFLSIVQHQYVWAMIAYIFTYFDAIDGMVARATHRVTPFGELLDATLDRVSDTLIVTSFGFAGLVRWELVIFLFAASYLISYVSARTGETGKGTVKLTGGIMELQDRRIALFFGLFSLFFQEKVLGFSYIEIVFLILSILSAITIVQRTTKAYKLLLKH